MCRAKRQFGHLKVMALAHEGVWSVRRLDDVEEERREERAPVAQKKEERKEERAAVVAAPPKPEPAPAPVKAEEPALAADQKPAVTS